jgi:two-component system, LytTR family, sensor kinase
MRVSLKRPGWLEWSSGRHTSFGSFFWLLQAGGWGAFAALLVGRALVLDGARGALLAAAVAVLQGFALTIGLRWVFRRWRRRPVRLAWLATGIAAASGLGAAAWCAAQEGLLRLLGGDATPATNAAMTAALLDRWLLYALVVLTWSLLYFGANTWIALELERDRAVRLRVSAKSARLQALQSQLEPHFLFNTLNSISSLVVEQRDIEATAMIARLSDFLRLTLQTAGTPEIRIADELAFVRQYLDIQKLRFGDRLRFAIDVAPEVENAVVPALVLQPLVENAVHHGILPRASGGAVTISARAAEGTLLLSVDDDGPGMRKSTSSHSGLGLSNTATRLSELYGGDAQFTVGRSHAGGVAAGIRIPLRFQVTAGFKLQPEECDL